MAKKESEIISRMDELMTEYNKEKKQTQRMSLIFGISLFVVLLFVAFLTIHNISNNFTADNIASTMTEKVESIRPLLPEYGRKLIDGIPEAYSTALAQELKTKMPIIQERFMKETNELSNQLRTIFENKLNEKLGANFIDNQIKIISGSNVSKLDIKEHQAMVREELGKLIENASTNFHALFEDDFRDLVLVLKDFPRENKALANEQEASKLLIHYLLSMVDTQIMAAK